jgi:hypothetical protein
MPVKQAINSHISHFIHVYRIWLHFFTPSVTTPPPCFLKERLLILIVVTLIEFLVRQLTFTNEIVQSHARHNNFCLLA